MFAVSVKSVLRLTVTPAPTASWFMEIFEPNVTVAVPVKGAPKEALSLVELGKPDPPQLAGFDHAVLVVPPPPVQR